MPNNAKSFVVTKYFLTNSLKWDNFPRHIWRSLTAQWVKITGLKNTYIMTSSKFFCLENYIVVLFYLLSLTIIYWLHQLFSSRKAVWPLLNVTKGANTYPFCLLWHCSCTTMSMTLGLVSRFKNTTSCHHLCSSQAPGNTISSRQVAPTAIIHQGCPGTTSLAVTPSLHTRNFQVSWVLVCFICFVYMHRLHTEGLQLE